MHYGVNRTDNRVLVVESDKDSEQPALLWELSADKDQQHSRLRRNPTSVIASNLAIATLSSLSRTVTPTGTVSSQRVRRLPTATAGGSNQPLSAHLNADTEYSRHYQS